MEMTKLNLPTSEGLKEHWRKEAEGRQINTSYDMQKFADRVFLYVTYPLKGNAWLGVTLLEAGWELSIERFGGVIRQPNGILVRGMLTQYRIQVDPSSWKGD